LWSSFRQEGFKTKPAGESSASLVKIQILARLWWLKPIILATKEAEIRRILV
jgi:hypothetical protein